jgi:hypothetical protein
MGRATRKLGCAVAAGLMIGFSFNGVARAINVTGGATADSLVNMLVGNSGEIQVVPGSASLTQFVGTGPNDSAGTFTNADFAPFQSGVLLTNGSISDVVGPNTSTGQSQSNGLPGDSDLNTLAGGSTFDATILTFQFKTTTKSSVSFQYFFGSEEYPEFVNEFNDVFGFFLNGTNIALIPNTTDPVAINNIHLAGTSSSGPYPAKNAQFYFDNNFQDGTAPANTQLDALVGINANFPLFASGDVIPGNINTIKLAIADGGDSALDSAVFLKAGSFQGGPPPTVPLPASAWAGLMMLGAMGAGSMLRNRKHSAQIG